MRDDVLLTAFHGWADHDPFTRRFAKLTLALATARALSRSDYPIVDIAIIGLGIVASRRLVAHPDDHAFTPTDTIGA